MKGVFTMKKIINSFISLSLCGTFLTCPLNAFAADVAELPEDEDSEIFVEEKEWRTRIVKPLKMETELFSYDSLVQEDIYNYDDKGTPLYSDAEGLKNANYMVTGVFYYESGSKYYTLMPVNGLKDYPSYARAFTMAKTFDNFPECQDLQPGDFLYITKGTWAESHVPELFPPSTHSRTEQSSLEVEYIGYGTDILGEEFADVIIQELAMSPNYITNQRYDGYDLPEGSNILVKRGDVTNTGEVNIVDVIAVNKNILGKETLNARGQLAADVNQNCKVDSGDSLEILKYVVGLNETL